MKKKIVFLFVASFVFVIGTKKVNAAGASCVYSVRDNITLNCEVDENGVSCKFKGSSSETSKYMTANNNSLTPVNFQSNKKWKCKSTIYAYISKMGNASSPGVTYELFSTNTDETDLSFPLVATKSSDGGDVPPDSPIGDEESINCQYGKLIITYNKTKNLIGHNNPCTTTILNFGASDLNECPAKLWVSGYGSTCSYNLKQQGGQGGWVELNGEDPIPDADEEEKEIVIVEPEYSFSNECVSCGDGMLENIPSRLPQFVRNIVLTLQMLTPIILIGLGIYDFVKAVIASDEKIMKESQNRFIKRIIAAILIFLVVAIVKFVFSLIPGDSTLGCIPCFISDGSSCSEEYSCAKTEDEITETDDENEEEEVEHGGGGHSR